MALKNKDLTEISPNLRKYFVISKTGLSSDITYLIFDTHKYILAVCSDRGAASLFLGAHVQPPVCKKCQ